MLFSLKSLQVVEWLWRLLIEISCDRETCQSKSNSKDILHLLMLQSLIVLANFLQVVIEQSEFFISELDLTRFLII